MVKRKPPPTPLAERVMALRKRLGLSQAGLADAGGLSRLDVLAIEHGRNKASSNRIRRGLAAAFGLARDAADAYIDGNLPLEQAVAMSTRSLKEAS